MSRKESDDKWLSYGEALKKAQEDYMNAEPGTEAYLDAKNAYTEQLDIILKEVQEERKIAWDKTKTYMLIGLRGVESVGMILFAVVFCGFEATNSMTSKYWPIISKKLSTLGFYSTPTI